MAEAGQTRVAVDTGRPQARPSRPARQQVVSRRPKGPRPSQRQPSGGVLHPENFPVYEEWIAQFSSLPTFTARDTVPDLDPRTNKARVDPTTNRVMHPTTSDFEVFGPAAASHDPTRPA